MGQVPEMEPLQPQSAIRRIGHLPNYELCPGDSKKNKAKRQATKGDRSVEARVRLSLFFYKIK